MNSARLLLGVVFVVGVATIAHSARVSPPTSAATATTESLGGVGTTDGWCVDTNGTTAVDVDAAAPARMTTTLKARVRFVGIKFFAGATSTRVCHRLGGALPATSCDALDGDTVGVLTNGEGANYAAVRDFDAGDLPQMEIQANAGTDGSVCVTVGW